MPITIRPKEFTLAVTAQAVFTLLSSTRTGLDDLTFCMSFSGRDTAIPSILSIAGPTLFTIPFRSQIDRKASLFTFLDSIRQSILTIAQYGHIGLSRIRRVSPDAGQACNFRSLFAVHSQHLEAPEAVFGPRLSFREDMGKLGLLFECWIVDGGVDLVAEYNCSSLGKPQVEQFVHQFASLLPKLLSLSPETLISDIDPIVDGNME